MPLHDKTLKYLKWCCIYSIWYDSLIFKACLNSMMLLKHTIFCVVRMYLWKKKITSGYKSKPPETKPWHFPSYWKISYTMMYQFNIISVLTNISMVDFPPIKIKQCRIGLGLQLIISGFLKIKTLFTINN